MSLKIDKDKKKGGVLMEENNQNTTEENVEQKNEQKVVTEEVKEEVKEGEVMGTDGFDAKDKEEHKIMGILCYLGFLVLIPYFTEKESKWVKYHALRGMNLLIIELIGVLLGMIPIIGSIASFIIGIYTFVISIMGIIQVCNCEVKELPLLDRFQFIKQ